MTLNELFLKHLDRLLTRQHASIIAELTTAGMPLDEAEREADDRMWKVTDSLYNGVIDA